MTAGLTSILLRLRTWGQRFPILVCMMRTTFNPSECDSWSFCPSSTTCVLIELTAVARLLASPLTLYSNYAIIQAETIE